MSERNKPFKGSGVRIGSIAHSNEFAPRAAVGKASCLIEDEDRLSGTGEVQAGRTSETMYVLLQGSSCTSMSRIITPAVHIVAATASQPEERDAAVDERLLLHDSLFMEH